MFLFSFCFVFCFVFVGFGGPGGGFGAPGGGFSGSRSSGKPLLLLRLKKPPLGPPKPPPGPPISKITTLSRLFRVLEYGSNIVQSLDWARGLLPLLLQEVHRQGGVVLNTLSRATAS